MISYDLKINLSDAKEVPNVLEYDYDDNKIYWFENMSLEETKEKLD